VRDDQHQRAHLFPNRAADTRAPWRCVFVNGASVLAKCDGRRVRQVSHRNAIFAEQKRADSWEALLSSSPARAMRVMAFIGITIPRRFSGRARGRRRPKVFQREIAVCGIRGNPALTESAGLFVFHERRFRGCVPRLASDFLWRFGQKNMGESFLRRKRAEVSKGARMVLQGVPGEPARGCHRCHSGRWRLSAFHVEQHDAEGPPRCARERSSSSVSTSTATQPRLVGKSCKRVG